jgi:cytidylate kinase
MGNLLLKYMNERIRQDKNAVIKSLGPVITISRECGCSGRLFAEKLTERINQRINKPAQKWKWVNKEILCLASKELKINPDQIKSLINGDNKNFFEEIASSFLVKYYAHNDRIRRVIKDVILHLAIDGRVIIIGRGSEVVTKDIENSLHIKLYAPLKWKVKEISNHNKISVMEAEKHVVDTDKNRLKFVNSFLDKEKDKVVYDIEFNCAKFSLDEIVEIVLKVAENKSLI